MKLELNSSIDFIITDGHIMSKNNEPFYVEKSGNSLIVTDDNISNSTINFGNNTMSIVGGNNISMNGNSLSINGITIVAKGKTLDIKGKVDSIVLNGNTLKLTELIQDKELKENQHKFFKLDKNSVDAIFVKNGGFVEIEDLSVINEDALNLAVHGSGDIITHDKGHFVKSLNLLVQGSGDIKVSKFQSDSCNCSVMGSGDIDLILSDFNNAMLSIMGSGDITGKNTTVNNISKNVMGSGDINGL